MPRPGPRPSVTIAARDTVTITTGLPQNGDWIAGRMGITVA